MPQQAPRHARPAAPLLGGVVDLAAVDGDEGELGRDEEPVGQDEQDDGEKSERGADGERSPVGRLGRRPAVRQRPRSYRCPSVSGSTRPTSARGGARARAGARSTPTTARRRAPRRAGPAAITRPSASSRRWVNPTGISSTWWVTSTVAGVEGSAARSARPATRSSRPARSSPAVGSSSSSSPGSGISVRASSTRWRSPDESVAKLRSARWPMPSCTEARPGPLAVGVVVAVPPRLEGRVLGRHHHVERREVGAEHVGHPRAGHADPRAQGCARRPGRGAGRARRRCPRSGGGRATRCAAATTCPSRCGRAPPTAPRRRPPR